MSIKNFQCITSRDNIPKHKLFQTHIKCSQRKKRKKNTHTQIATKNAELAKCYGHSKKVLQSVIAAFSSSVRVAITSSIGQDTVKKIKNLGWN